MRKLITSIVAVLYLAVSSGFVLNVHYCMGKVSGVSVDNVNPKVCSCAKPKKKSACCSSTFKLIKLEDAHKAAAITAYQSSIQGVLPVTPSFINPVLPEASLLVKPVRGSPPLSSASNIYLRNCVFRI
ncbi:hypothetical protein EXU57_05475 [Segetibacter sp. 3557_3]|uniref:HYC_CC_PP family protein n=1 Tax=Segetibacter sp. 3557_3 TaxID=2547429 RepID=UPI00105887C2|nr:hypothetical protein [Segetibacter sp. 3557_3]TDH27917.1 hypothetical protein EXU57_05475 [Segetibacter sp. 3557_3]